MWFIPLSSKVNKYKKIINNKVKKYGCCDGILIRKIYRSCSSFREWKAC